MPDPNSDLTPQAQQMMREALEKELADGSLDDSAYVDTLVDSMQDLQSMMPDHSPGKNQLRLPDFGDGPWQNEPDQRMWRDEATGYMCAILRSETMGQLNGYVAVPEDHPLHNAKLGSTGEGVECEASALYGSLKVHGNATYAGTLKVDEKDTWWVGFDCAHATTDLIPMAWGSNFPSKAGVQYRDFGYVQGQCAKLALQLAALA